MRQGSVVILKTCSLGLYFQYEYYPMYLDTCLLMAGHLSFDVSDLILTQASYDGEESCVRDFQDPSTHHDNWISYNCLDTCRVLLITY
jgi:hypothetical protein